MDRMYMTAIMEQFQDHVETKLKAEEDERLKWQDMLEGKFKEFTDQIETRVETLSE